MYQINPRLTEVGKVNRKPPLLFFCMEGQATMLPLLSKPQLKPWLSREYLHLLQQKKTTLQTKIISIYFLLWSAGLGLYFYEYTLLMSPLGAFLAYSLTALWMAFNWCFLRPRIIKKQQGELQTLLEELKSLGGQLVE